MTASAPDSNPRPRVLLVEDDVRLAGAFARRLEAEYLAVDVVGTVADARDLERRSPYVCLVLDRLLPDGDSIELVQEIDVRPTRPPIVVVSAVADEQDRIEGLLAGADDYVAKPVHLDELAVRVTRLLELVPEVTTVPTHPIEVGDVWLDPQRLRVRIGGEPIVLPRAHVLLLRALMLHPDRPVRTADLLAACAGSDEGLVAASLPAHLEALARSLDGRLLIEQIPRRGYVLRQGAARPEPSRSRRLRQRVAGRRRPT